MATEVKRKTKVRRFHDMEESLANLVQQLGEVDKVRILASITNEEHNALAVVSAYAGWLNSNLLKNFVENYLLLSVSRKGLGRKQLTAIGIANRTEYSEDEKFFAKVKRKLHIGE